MAERRCKEAKCSRRKGKEVGMAAREDPSSPRFASGGGGDWGRFGLRSPRGSAPSSSTPHMPARTRTLAEPRAEAQVMKLDPKKSVKLSKLLDLSVSSEEDPMWEG
jgi:hypothetical protein